MCVTCGRGAHVDDIIHGEMEVSTGVFILSGRTVGVHEYDRAMDYLQTPGVLSMADVELLHTRVAQSVT